MSDTPLTDAEMKRIEADEKQYEDRHDCYCALLSFARALERQLAEVRAEGQAAKRQTITAVRQAASTQQEIEALRAELIQARSVADGLAGALGFYASPANHRPQWTEAIVNPSAIDSDQGKRAQAALAAYAALTGGKGKEEENVNCLCGVVATEHCPEHGTT